MIMPRVKFRGRRDSTLAKSIFVLSLRGTLLSSASAVYR